MRRRSCWSAAPAQTRLSAPLARPTAHSRAGLLGRARRDGRGRVANDSGPGDLPHRPSGCCWRSATCGDGRGTVDRDTEAHRGGAGRLPSPVRIALVSPYSYTYPGGVGRHVEALAQELLAPGHEVAPARPYDPDDRSRAATASRRAPAARPMPDYLIPLGRTRRPPVERRGVEPRVTPAAVAALGRELRRGGYDVVHVHEPNAPVVELVRGRGRAAAARRHVPHLLDERLRAHAATAGRRAAALQQASRADRRVGGRALDRRALLRRPLPDRPERRGPRGARPGRGRAVDQLRLLFVGRAEERKGLPVLLRAFEALREAGVDARLTVAGATREEVEPLPARRRGRRGAGRVTEDEKWRLLHEADLLCAPSLGGESFGMVLTEAFAAGTPVVVLGHRRLPRRGARRRRRVLVPPGEPAALGEALHALALDPERRARMAAAARERAERFALADGGRAGGRGLRGGHQRAALRAPRRATRSRSHGPPRRPRAAAPRAGSPRSSPSLGAGRRRAGRVARRGWPPAPPGRPGSDALALQRDRPGVDRRRAARRHARVGARRVRADVRLDADACRGVARGPPRRRCRTRGCADATPRGATMIGVLMSATLPARLGEPSRALIVARRLGRVRERLPVVLGTLVSQTLLNIVALVILGAVMFATVGVFQGNEDELVVATVATGLVLALVLVAPAAPAPRAAVAVRARCSNAATARGRDRPGRRASRSSGNPRLGRGRRSRSSTAWARPVARLLRAARGARPRRPRRDGRRGRGPVRGERHGRAARDAVEPRRLPGRVRGRALRLRRRPDGRVRLRDRPAGGGDRDGAGDGHARAPARGHDVEGHAPARHPRGTGRTCGPRSKRRPKRHQRQFPRSSALSFRDGADARKQTGVAARARARMRVLGAARCRPGGGASGQEHEPPDEAGDDPIANRGDRYVPKPPGHRRRCASGTARTSCRRAGTPTASTSTSRSTTASSSDRAALRIDRRWRSPSHQVAHIHHAHWFALDPGNERTTTPAATPMDLRQRRRGDQRGLQGALEPPSRTARCTASTSAPRGPQPMIYMLHNKTAETLDALGRPRRHLHARTSEQLNATGREHPTSRACSSAAPSTCRASRRRRTGPSTARGRQVAAPIEWTSTVDGTMIGTGGHVHPGGYRCSPRTRVRGEPVPRRRPRVRRHSPLELGRHQPPGAALRGLPDRGDAARRGAHRSTRATGSGSPASTRTRSTPGTRR